MYPKEQELTHECWLQQRETEIALQGMLDRRERHYVRRTDGVLIDVTESVRCREQATVARMKKACALVGRTDA